MLVRLTHKLTRPAFWLVKRNRMSTWGEICPGGHSIPPHDKKSITVERSQSPRPNTRQIIYDLPTYDLRPCHRCGPTCAWLEKVHGLITLTRSWHCQYCIEVVYCTALYCAGLYCTVLCCNVMNIYLWYAQFGVPPRDSCYILVLFVLLTAYTPQPSLCKSRGRSVTIFTV